MCYTLSLGTYIYIQGTIIYLVFFLNVKKKNVLKNYPSPIFFHCHIPPVHNRNKKHGIHIFDFYLCIIYSRTIYRTFCYNSNNGIMYIYVSEKVSNIDICLNNCKEGYILRI